MADIFAVIAVWVLKTALRIMGIELEATLRWRPR
jgi:hypothetical protein